MLEIEKQKRNELLGREEIVAALKEDLKNDSSEEKIKALLADELKKNPELIVIKGVDSKFGAVEKKVEAYIYDTIEALKIFEPVKKVKEKEAEVEEVKKVEKKEEKKEEKKWKK